MKLLNEKQAAEEWLKISRFTLRKMRHEGRGPKFLRIGRQVRYRPEDLDEYAKWQVRVQETRQTPEEEAAWERERAEVAASLDRPSGEEWEQYPHWPYDEKGKFLPFLIEKHLKRITEEKAERKRQSEQERQQRIRRNRYVAS
jgi:hypothetical protein